MKKISTRKVVAALAIASSLVPLVATAVETPVTPGAQTHARGLLNWLSNIQGTYIVSGQMEGSPIEAPFDRIYGLTGKYPGLRGFDFSGFSADRPSQDDVTSRAINWYTKTNGIVEIQWHWYMKGSDGTVEVYANLPTIKGTDFDISKAVIDGTDENRRFLADIDSVAIQLQRLQANGVPVLWRPFHEASGAFWWGAKGSAPLKQAWKIMFNRLVKDKGLTNLIWVFNPAYTADLSTWYPGDEYVDVISYDGYGAAGEHPTFSDQYALMKAFAGNGKLVTMTENGGIPDTTQLATQGANWFSFMTWGGTYATDPAWNNDSFLKSTYSSQYVLSRDELPALASLPKPLVYPAIKLQFTRQPENSFKGETWIKPVYVGLVDVLGQVVRNLSGKINFTYGQAVTQVDIVNGVARFNPTFTVTSTNQTVSASLPDGSYKVTSTPFNVGISSDTSQFNFESTLNGWTASQAISLTSQHAYAGNNAMSLTLANAMGESSASVVLSNATGITPPQPGGQVRIRVWVPEGKNLHGMSAFVKENAAGSWSLTRGAWVDRTQIVAGTWNTVTVTVPTNAAPLYQLGVSLYATDGTALNGTFFIDSVSW